MTIEIGTISHGTMREQDLIPAFFGVLDAEAPAESAKIRDEFGPAFIERCCDPLGLEYSTMGELDQQAWLMERLWLALEEFAPEGTYFGAIDGDGSDYGFWADDEPDDRDQEAIR